MSGQPPPGPQISPDGRYYWDGARWVPRYPPQAPAPKRSTGRTSGTLAIVAITVVVVVVVAIFGGIAWFVTHQSCTEGYAGTDLQVTAEGVHAHDFCQGFKNSNSSAYDLDQPDTTGTLMCRYTLSDGTTVTVRDKGALKLYGNAECQQLAQQAGDQGLPTPST